MSVHIGADAGQIAPAILLPGDPLRARHIAETMLEEPVCFNKVRGMLGYTGGYQGKRISVMGTGMGIPSASIYIHELITEYQVRTLIRVGTCGAFQPSLEMGDIVLAQAASTDSQVNKVRFQGRDYAPSASFELLLEAYQIAVEQGLRFQVGGVFSGDTFYEDDPEGWRLWASYGVLAVDMETAGLYTLAAKFQAKALSILTVSNSLVTGEETTASQREKDFNDMVKIALAIGS